MQDSNSGAAGAGYEEVLKGGADQIGKTLNRGSGTKRVCFFLLVFLLPASCYEAGGPQPQNKKEFWKSAGPACFSLAADSTSSAFWLLGSEAP